MRRSEKEAVVQDMAERLGRAQAVVLTDFSGLKVEQMTELRRRLRQGGQEYLVIKNTLFRLATQGTPAESLAKEALGPNGVGLSFDEPVDLAKILVEFAKENPKLEIKQALLQDKLINPAQVAELAKLPGREILLAQLLGVMNGVARNLVGVLAAVPRNFLGVLKAIEEKKAAEAA